MRRAAPLVVCLAAGGCASGPAAVPDASAPAADDRAPVGAEVVHAGPAAELDAYISGAVRADRLDRDGVVRLFGTPDSVGRRAVTNRHDPSITDTLVSLHYGGTDYVYYVVSSSDRDLLDLARIAANHHLALVPPGIGTPADSLRTWFGEPLRDEPGALTWDCMSCEVPRPVTFRIGGNGRVIRIDFDFYVD